MANYDKYYETEDLFGGAYPELIDFFEKYKPKGSILDLGCGQGRDAIPLARLGYKVTGIDSSKTGISQMIEKAKKENLKIEGYIEDIFAMDNFKDFDVILLDSMFHFGKREKKTETGLITKIVNQLKISGLLCICIQDSGTKVKIMKEAISSTGRNYDILNDSSLTYKFEDKESKHISETKYCMYILKMK